MSLEQIVIHSFSDSIVQWSIFVMGRSTSLLLTFSTDQNVDLCKRQSVTYNLKTQNIFPKNPKQS